jgi:exodeoxyribonuclease-3
MRIATWNINSVRLRLKLVQQFCRDHDPDILCLQETKTPDEFFPLDDLKAEGFPYIHFQGMKGYNGVAILSKIPFTQAENHYRVGREDCRHISIKTKLFTLHNLYIPAGGDEPDPIANDKYAHKLDFVDEMARWFSDRHSVYEPLIALGDFNIAPYEHDVWSHKQLLNVVSHTPPETERLEKMRTSLNWVDTARHFIPMSEKSYSWWSYRNKDWRASNRGRRLDHIWITQPLKGALQSYQALSDIRDWEQPSDHVPVMIDLKL